jgi:hypothetical protein
MRKEQKHTADADVGGNGFNLEGFEQNGLYQTYNGAATGTSSNRLWIP